MAGSARVASDVGHLTQTTAGSSVSITFDLVELARSRGVVVD